MVRSYKKKESTRRLCYSQEDMAKALIELHEGKSERQVSALYGIPKTTLHKRFHGQISQPGQSGCHTALSCSDETAIAENLATLGDFGFAFDLNEMCKFICDHLNKMNRQIQQFKDNLPGRDWAYGFMNRHKYLLSSRRCQNISRKRAAVSKEMVHDYFVNLCNTLEEVSPYNIINYDETNLTDDPGSKVMIFRRGIKHAERIINTTKSSTSLMFACTAMGDVLPPYVVYKAERLQDSWLLGGPLNVKYNRSKSGWFDADIFVDWIRQIVIPYVRRLPKEEYKVLIGDNLASHISFEAVNLCVDNNIKMVFFPPNSTHLLQPLDVAVYGPMKIVWRRILTEWKMGEGKHMTTLPKWCFPLLLLKLMSEMENKWQRLSVAGFKSCGIHPLNPEHVISKLTRDSALEYPHREHVSQNLLTYLQDQRETSVRHQKQRSKKVQVAAGVSISLADLEAPSSSGATNSRGTGRGRKRQIRNDSEPEDEIQSTDEVQEEAFDHSSLILNEYVLVRFMCTKTSVPYHFVAQLKEQLNHQWKVHYFRRIEFGKAKIGCLTFQEPEVLDVGLINNDQIIMEMKPAQIYKNKIMFKNVFQELLIR